MLSPFVKQVFALSGCISIYFMYGYMLGLQAIFLPLLRKDGSEISLTTEQESWIPSSMIIMQLPAQVIGGIVADMFGIKIVVIMSMLPGVAACLLLYYAENCGMLITAYCFSGLIFMGTTFGPIIVAESVSPKYRGAMLAIKLGFCTLALGFTHALGPICYWRNLALSGLIPCVLGLIVLFITPESPAWLAKQGRFDEAKRSFKWYRGDNDIEELNQLIKSQEIKFNQNTRNTKSKVREFISFISDKKVLKSLSICSVIFIYMETTGKRLFFTFSSDIILSIVHSKENLTLYALIFDIIDMSSYILTGFYMHRIGRRSLMLLTGIPSILLIAMFFTVSNLINNGILFESYSKLSMVLFLANFVPLSLGVTPVLSALSGEVIPLSHKGFVVSILGIVIAATMFLFTKLTQSTFLSIGVQGTYLVYAGISAFCLISIYCMCPETNLKTLIDVENEMGGEKNLQSDVLVELKTLVPNFRKDEKLKRVHDKLCYEQITS